MKELKIEDYLEVVTAKGIYRALPLLQLYIKEADELNRLAVKKKTAADRLRCSSRSVSNYVRILSEHDLIKYKYSGDVRINPNYYFVGRPKDFNKALSEYELFRKDI